MVIVFGTGITLDSKDINSFESQDAFDKFQEDVYTPAITFLGTFVVNTDTSKIGFRRFNVYDNSMPCRSHINRFNRYKPASNELILELRLICSNH